MGANTFVKIFGNQRVPFSSHRSFKLSQFNRHYIPGLNLAADFHYDPKEKVVRDRYVALLRQFGDFLQCYGITPQSRKLRFMLLPLISLNDTPTKKRKLGNGGIAVSIPVGRLKPVVGQFSWPNDIFIATRPDKTISNHWKNYFEKQGEEATIHEVIHALSSDLSNQNPAIVKCGIAIYYRNGKINYGLNEALTEFVAHHFYTQTTGAEISRGYSYLIDGIDLLAELIGLKPILESLFFKSLNPIESALAAKGLDAEAIREIVTAADKDHDSILEKLIDPNPEKHLVDCLCRLRSRLR